MVDQIENSKSTALIAEDDAMIRELVALYLDRMGYQVLEASDGREAIDLIADQKEDHLKLIVTDLVMPKAGGAEVVQSARSSGKCDKILIISGFTEDLSFLEKTIKDGSAFLKKPFTFDDFAAKVEDLQKLAS